MPKSIEELRGQFSHLQDNEGIRYSVLYQKNPRFTSMDFYVETDYQYVLDIRVPDPEDAYHLMQGEQWSPNSEARELIRTLKLWHTSMSVGDVLLEQESGDILMCHYVGFKKVPALTWEIYTKLENREKHMIMWRWLAETNSGTKANFFEWLDSKAGEEPAFLCYACQEAIERSGKCDAQRCEDCPIDWQNTDPDVINACAGEHTPYIKWFDSVCNKGRYASALVTLSEQTWKI